MFRFIDGLSLFLSFFFYKGLLILETDRRSHHRCSVRKYVLRNFAKFTEKNLCQSLFFNKVTGPRQLYEKKRLWQRCFPVNFTKFYFLQNTSRRLLLHRTLKSSKRVNSCSLTNDCRQHYAF